MTVLLIYWWPGRYSRTSREVEILRQLLDGNQNRDIAEKLFITEEAVKAHMKRIIRKAQNE